MKRIKKFNQYIKESSIPNVIDSKIIVGNRYTILKYDTQVVVIEKDDDKKKAFVTSDLIDKTGGFWINYNKLK